MRSAQRDLLSEPSEVPFGITVTADGRTDFISYERFEPSPLRRQLREAHLAMASDRGGGARSLLTMRNYTNGVRHLLGRLHGPESVPDARRLEPGLVHRRLLSLPAEFAGYDLALARRLLLVCAESVGNDDLAAYLRNAPVHTSGRAEGTRPYSSEELLVVLDWARGRLHAWERRNADALRLLGLDARVDDEMALAAAEKHLGSTRSRAGCPPPGASDETWWVAQLYANGFAAQPESRSAEARLWARAREALFPQLHDALATVMLVINEYGFEAQALQGLCLGDVRRVGGASSAVLELSGWKARADREVSRRGNAVSAWSGGRVIERWIRLTAPARRWSGSDRVWQFWTDRTWKTKELLREPIVCFPQTRPMMPGTRPLLPMPNGSTLAVSTRRMRATNIARAERALGPATARALDPGHSSRVAWAVYRSAAVGEDERKRLVADAQDDLRGMVTAAKIAGAGSLGSDPVAVLIGEGVEASVADRLVRGQLSDSGLTYCSDPRRAPGQVVGTLCRRMPFLCLVCPNGVFTAVHLPVLLALAETLEADRGEMPAEEFVARWGGVDVGLEHVLKRFSAAAVETARGDLNEARQRIRAFREVQE